LAAKDGSTGLSKNKIICKDLFVFSWYLQVRVTTMLDGSHIAFDLRKDPNQPILNHSLLTSLLTNTGLSPYSRGGK
jgi:hypothetical protein